MLVKSEKVKARMKELGLTPEKLAVAAGCTAPTIYNITKEKGKRTHPNNVKAIAKVLKVKLDEIVMTPQEIEESKA